MRSRSRATAIFGTVVLGMVGCEAKDIPGFPQEESGVKIDFSSPDNGDEINSSSVKVRVRVDGIRLSEDDIGSEHVSGEGHYHWYVDGSAAGEGAKEAFLVTDLPEGEHEITARLFQN